MIEELQWNTLETRADWPYFTKSTMAKLGLPQKISNFRAHGEEGTRPANNEEENA